MTLGGLPAEPQSQRLSGGGSGGSKDLGEVIADIHWVCAFRAGAALILLGVRKWVYQILIYPIL